MGSNRTNKGPIILFDGICGLCNKSVDYILQKDNKALFKFAALQSKFAETYLLENKFDHLALDSVILIYQQNIFFKSRAAAKILILLGGAQSILGRIILLVPEKLANTIYDWIARNRYKWFGKLPTCRIPSANERSRFLE